MAKNVNNIIYSIEVDTTSGKISIDGVTKSFEQADKAFLKLQKDVAKGIPNATKNVKNLGDATGSATSATMELSRVISDAPYGIRGMANNITQLVSQLGTASTKAGGLTSALKLMGKQLMGPLGIVFAITAAVSALDYFFGAQKKAEEASEETTNALERQRKELAKLTEGYDDLNKIKQKVIQTTSKEREKMKALVAATLDSTNSDERKQRALSQLIKLYPKYFKGLNIGEIKNLYDAEEKVDRILQRKLKLKHQLKRAEEIANEIQIEKIKIAKDSKNADLAKIGRLREEQKEVRELIQIYLASDMELKLDKSSDSSKKLSPFKTPKELEIDIKSAENAMIQMSKRLEDARLEEELNDALSQAKTEEEKQQIREAYQVKRLKSQIKAEGEVLKLKKTTEENMVKTKTDNHIDDLKKAKELFETKVRYEQSLGKLTKKQADSLIEDSKSKFEKAETQALSEQKTSMSEIASKYEPLFQLFEDLSAARLDALFSGFSLKKSGSEEEEFTLEQGLQKLMEVTSAATDFMNSEFDRQITIERNKTNALNNELNKRLLNENLSKEERKRIQLEIGANDEKLRRTQEKIEKKKFKLNKAANIAQATISAYLAGAQVLANEKLGAVGRIAAMTAVVSSGLLQVASIARTKFQSSAGSGGQIGGGFGGSDGGRDRSFNFNLAGASRENQLAQTLQGRFDQPLQAYVVSRDITNQQQLDEEITSSASFG